MKFGVGGARVDGVDILVETEVWLDMTGDHKFEDELPDVSGGGIKRFVLPPEDREELEVDECDELIDIRFSGHGDSVWMGAGGDQEFRC